MAVRYRAGAASAWIVAETRDIGVGGAFIVTRAQPSIGTTLTIELTLPTSDQRFTLPAVVRWCRPGDDGGMGVQFVGVDVDVLLELNDYFATCCDLEVWVVEGESWVGGCGAVGRGHGSGGGGVGDGWVVGGGAGGGAGRGGGSKFLGVGVVGVVGWDVAGSVGLGEVVRGGGVRVGCWCCRVVGLGDEGDGWRGAAALSGGRCRASVVEVGR